MPIRVEGAYCEHCGSDKFVKKIKTSVVGKAAKSRKMKAMVMMMMVLFTGVATGAYIYSRINPQGMELYNPNYDTEHLTMVDIMDSPGILKEGLFENVKLGKNTITDTIMIDLRHGKSDRFFNITIQYNPDLFEMTIDFSQPTNYFVVKYIDYGSYKSILLQGFDDGSSPFEGGQGWFHLETTDEDAYFDIYCESFYRPFENSTTINTAFNLDYLMNDTVKLRNIGYSEAPDLAGEYSPWINEVYFTFNVSEISDFITYIQWGGTWIGNAGEFSLYNSNFDKQTNYNFVFGFNDNKIEFLNLIPDRYYVCFQGISHITGLGVDFTLS
jgi:hypothetical protein